MMNCRLINNGNTKSIICGGQASTGYIVKTKAGIIGKTKHKEELLNGKVKVYTDKDNLLCLPDTVNVLDEYGLHDCDSEGHKLVFNDSGEYFTTETRPIYSCEPIKYVEWMEKHGIRGGCCSCSVCGKPFTPPMY